MGTMDMTLGLFIGQTVGAMFAAVTLLWFWRAVYKERQLMDKETRDLDRLDNEKNRRMNPETLKKQRP